VKPSVHWGAMWRSNCKMEGKTRHLIYDNCLPVLFRTKKACQEWIKKKHGYIATRKDLRAEPHGWRMPIPIRVEVTGQTQ